MNNKKKITMEINATYDLEPSILNLLLKDNTTKKNIIWATNNYAERGINYYFESQIYYSLITGINSEIIKPRVKKTKKEQNERIKNKAEVFTPSWVCNSQNNLIDEKWFGYKDVFNKREKENKWITNLKKINFINSRTWMEYVNELRMEVSCGEAPYLVSRYDTVTGKLIKVNDRIGLLDRKIRIINENVDLEEEWYSWIIKAYKSIYGYEWQGDNLLLARENLLFTFIDNYIYKFSKYPSLEQQEEISYIISWNLWQMDGVKFVVPNSCRNEESIVAQLNLFGEEEKEKIECYGCKKNNYKKHNGIYSKIMNWHTNRTKLFYKLIEEGNKNEKQ